MITCKFCSFSRIIKFFLTSILLIMIVLGLWVITPRIWSSLNPGKPPLGYYFTPMAYLALWLGLEKQADLEPDIPPDIEEIKNIEYKNIDGKSLQLDIYRPANHDKPLPLIVFIHGGSWKSGKRSDYLVYLFSYAKKGYMTATVSYRLLKDGPYPACIEDIYDAVKWLYSNAEKFGYDTSRIALVGGSAGAHLAMLAGYGWKNRDTTGDSLGFQSTGSAVKAVVDIYGPADLTTVYARNHPLITSFLNTTWDESPDIFREASPVNYLDKNDPPTLILHGTSDRLVPVSQSEQLKDKLDSINVPCIFNPLPGWPHTMDIVQRVNDYCQEKMDLFFSQYLN